MKSTKSEDLIDTGLVLTLARNSAFTIPAPYDRCLASLTSFPSEASDERAVWLPTLIAEGTVWSDNLKFT